MTRKIDRRIHYFLVVDTETANTLVDDQGKLDMQDVLFYDCGWAVIDKRGKVYETASFINKDIFYDEERLMQSAYYANKIPKYLEEIKDGARKVKNTFEIRKAMLETIKKYRIKHVCAHNARFDANALNRTCSYTSMGQFRYWFPFDSIVWYDTMKMAETVICQMPTYKRFCQENGYCLKNGKPRKTAEILYRFISKNNNFTESHTGLEDVMIEKEILVYCYRQKKKMTKELWENKSNKEKVPLTQFQKDLFINLLQFPTLRTV